MTLIRIINRDRSSVGILGNTFITVKSCFTVQFEGKKNGTVNGMVFQYGIHPKLLYNVVLYRDSSH